MERIKQALERAKQEREVVSGHTAPHAPGKPGRPDGIVYTQTHVFTPEPKVLRDNRVITGPDTGAATDAYRMLRTRMLQKMREIFGLRITNTVLSYIINVSGNGVNSLAEAEFRRQELVKYEHQLWHF